MSHDCCCRWCGEPMPCDEDCAERDLIYRESQREKLRDIEIDEESLDWDTAGYWPPYSD